MQRHLRAGWAWGLLFAGAHAFGALGHAPNGEGYAAATMPIAPELAKLKRLAVVREPPL